MPQIHFIPDSRSIELPEGSNLLECSLKSGIPFTHACGGNARCSTCRILVVEGSEWLSPRSEEENLMARKLRFEGGIRLACQVQVHGSVKIRRLVLDEEDYLLTREKGEGSPISPAGVEGKIAILFADIRGFTSFSEPLPTYDVIHTLDRYFHLMGKVIDQNGGVINNYMGDGLMALFEETSPVGPVHAAVKSGLQMFEELEKLKPYLLSLYGKSFEMGVGVHYGEVVLGTVGYGSGRRRTAIGDAVNVASRIESATKEAGARFLISEDAYDSVRERVLVGKKHQMLLRGKTGSNLLYEVLGWVNNF